MTALALAGTAALLPVYLAVRGIFARLPLHIDTGFYVSNHAVAARRWRFGRGWNARFAGGSKVLPEAFYTAVYLGGRGRYRERSRLWAGLVNYATAILVGWVSWRLGGRTEAAYLAGLVSYALISSEPFYGVYFENAELFELPFQAVGFGLMAVGTIEGAPTWVGVGAGLWFFESGFVKLSSLPAAAILSAAAVALEPRALGPAAVGVGAATALYLAWIVSLGRRPADLLGALVGHEAQSARRELEREGPGRLWRKARMLGTILGGVPVIPALAAAGLAAPGAARDWVTIYFGAVLAAFLFQTSRVWYYSIPLLVPLALSAARAELWALERWPAAPWALGGLAAGWAALMAARYVRPGDRDAAVWAPHGAAMAAKNRQLEEAAPAIREATGGRPFLVIGCWCQAYLLLDAAYDTPLVCAAPWLEAMHPGWRRELNEQISAQPPEFLLDTDGALDPAALERHLGLRYEPAGTFGSTAGFRLHRFTGSGPAPQPDLDATICAW